MDPHTPDSGSIWLDEESCSLEGFDAEIESRRDRVACPNAATVERGIPIYSAARVRDMVEDGEALRRIMSEWAHVLMHGPGVVVFKKVIADQQVLDGATAVLNDILRNESEGGAAGDHFAASGANSRIWNSHEKLCVAAPEVFARYNANDIVPSISRAWLGPGYQVTAQVNVVRPGGEAQRPHRDYHMGFQTAARLYEYPTHVHRVSPLLTLQGAVAHGDMPIESGPTKVLPFSQIYLSGYLAADRQEFQSYFEEHQVQLPLEGGDMMFLNPAVFHAAGANTTADLPRLANLLQISSGYGRSMETLDRTRMSAAVYPVLLELKRSGGLNAREVDNVIAATAEGYPFPANLDRDPPVSGMAPPSQQDLFRMAISDGWATERFRKALSDHGARRVSH